ncbi:hypothetical protein C8A01DRAFT_41562 [Parachaetomium inaequale]|uniref:Uncharacterized protein n=1 Tax=Parachaetomium inaequale TaxID=2588326 RepID=A0AAN6P5I9_9PEZI|nr:hypothetical protein C8A01DRAFT_41562 [Parachaetomium inaequale]
MKATRAGKVWESGIVFEYVQRETALQQAVTPMLDRRMCRTARGALGLVPPLARVADFIAVFAGANVPCVLRARPRLQPESRRQFEVVGPCNIKGIMHGELAEAQLAMEPIVLA